MNKYKLVKIYPGSPALGTISYPKDGLDINDGMHFFSGIWFDPTAYPDYWEKVKLPLFKTEDDVEIFEGDYWWYLYTEPIANWIESLWKAGRSGGTNHNYSPQYGDKIKRFSTKEKAEEYILMNKPCLSLIDVLNTWSSLPSSPTKDSLIKNSTLIAKLTEFTKNKINK